MIWSLKTTQLSTISTAKYGGNFPTFLKCAKTQFSAISKCHGKKFNGEIIASRDKNLQNQLNI